MKCKGNKLTLNYFNIARIKRALEIIYFLLRIHLTKRTKVKFATLTTQLDSKIYKKANQNN